VTAPTTTAWTLPPLPLSAKLALLPVIWGTTIDTRRVTGRFCFLAVDSRWLKLYTLFAEHGWHQKA
jgi:hypothetical protein